jgi:hypothetical protein
MATTQAVAPSAVIAVARLDFDPGKPFVTSERVLI